MVVWVPSSDGVLGVTNRGGWVVVALGTERGRWVVGLKTVGGYPNEKKKSLLSVNSSKEKEKKKKKKDKHLHSSLVPLNRFSPEPPNASSVALYSCSAGMPSIPSKSKGCSRLLNLLDLASMTFRMIKKIPNPPTMTEAMAIRMIPVLLKKKPGDGENGKGFT